MQLTILAAVLVCLSVNGYAQVDVGKKQFALCGACHSADGSAKPTGPTLKGISTRKAAADTGYKNYSKALKTSAIVWTEKELDAYLAAPSKRVPGTSMMINVTDAAKRKALIDYLKTLK
jgi:cytochrome c